MAIYLSFVPRVHFKHTTTGNRVFFSFASGEMRDRHESGVHHTTSQGRDLKAESGAPFAQRYRSEAAESTTAQTISRRQEKDCCCSAGTLGEDQSSKEIDMERNMSSGSQDAAWVENAAAVGASRSVCQLLVKSRFCASERISFLLS